MGEDSACGNAYKTQQPWALLGSAAEWEGIDGAGGAHQVRGQLAAAGCCRTAPRGVLQLLQPVAGSGREAASAGPAHLFTAGSRWV